MSVIWAACASRAKPVPLDGEVFRLVESQEQVATRALVDTLAEQSLLEDLIEASKPALGPASASLHYLLSTPFRYPPLPWGSRFGSRFDPALFYAARARGTALAESAYYRFVFWSGMVEPPPAPLETRHTLFSAGLRTDRGLRLQDSPFDEYVDELTDRRSYAATQALGVELRKAGIAAFEYRSARDRRGGINVALVTPEAFSRSRPSRLDEWLCETTATRVTFYSRHGGGLSEFPLDDFLLSGALPAPPG